MYSVLDNFGTDLTKKNYVTNPAIARENEIKNRARSGHAP